MYGDERHNCEHNRKKEQEKLEVVGPNINNGDNAVPDGMNNIDKEHHTEHLRHNKGNFEAYASNTTKGIFAMSKHDIEKMGVDRQNLGYQPAFGRHAGQYDNLDRALLVTEALKKILEK